MGPEAAGMTKVALDGEFVDIRSNESWDDPGFKPEEGTIFAKRGKPGERYVVVDKVFTLVSVGDGSVTVQYHGQSKPTTIARNSEVERFMPSRHSELLKKAAQLAEEEAEERRKEKDEENRRRKESKK